MVVAFATAASSAARAAEPAPDWDRPGQAGAFLTAAVREHSIGAFDGALARLGFPPGPRVLGGGGFGVFAALGRLRLWDSLTWQSADRANANASAIEIADVRLEAGYDVLRLDSLSAYVLGGLDLSEVKVDPRAVGVSSQDGDAKAETAGLVVHAGVEQVLPVARFSPRERLALTFAFDYAYTKQVSEADWSTGSDEHSIQGQRQLTRAERRSRCGSVSP